MLTNNKITRKS